MTTEMADRQEEEYLAFSAGGIGYVMPLADVGQIVADIPEEMPEIPFAGRGAESPCAVIFQDQSGLAALTVGKVTGLVRIPSGCQYEMPEQVRTAGNEWIAGVAFLESSRSLCYLLDCRKLRKHFAGEAP